MVINTYFVHWSRRLIDAALLRVLGYKGDKDSPLDRLYDSLAYEEAYG